MPKQHANALPTLWLLGKTGAGKSSIIQALTGNSRVQVGNGFAPCTSTAMAYDFPEENPVLRFLDTRGLGEAHYNANEDIALCQAQSHVLLVVLKADDPEQSAVLAALKSIRKANTITHVLLVHTAVHTVPAEARRRTVAHQQQAVAQVWGSALPAVEVDVDTEAHQYFQHEALVAALKELLPLVGLMLQQQENATQEEQQFANVRSEVLWYAAGTGASDLVPGVGLVSVPAMQGKMLHSLAKHYGVPWNARAFSELLGVLGSSFGVQYGVKLGARQLAKFIPVYGQTVGAATAAVVSFATTYGLGRAASYYFHRKSRGEAVHKEDIQALYQAAFEQGKKVAPRE